MKFLLSLVLSLITLPAFGETIDFHKDVAPILREYCAGCHNDIDLEGEFSVETFKTLMKGGENGVMIQSGNASDSLLIKAVTKKVKPYMPPRKEPQLTTQHIATLTAWINSGAKGPSDDHSILATLNVPKTASNKNATRPVTAIAVASNGQLAVGRYGEIKLGDKSLKGIPGKVNAIAISPDAKWLAVASGVPGLNGVAVLFELDSGDRVREFSQGHRDALYGVAFSPDSQRLGTAGYDRLIQLWDAKTGKLLNTLKGHNGAVYGIAFSPDGKVLASAGGDSSVKLWNTTTGQRLDTFGQPTGEQFITSFTPDSRHVIAAGADKQIRMWKWISGDQSEINPLERVRYAHEDEITDLAINQAGTRLATASADRSVKVWAMPSLEPLQTIASQPDVVSALAFSHDGNSLHVGRMDGSLQKYKLRVAKPKTTIAQTHTPQAPPQTALEQTELPEKEPNNDPRSAMDIKAPVKVTGVIYGKKEDDIDVFRFAAKAGEQWVIEINAARSKSPLDSKVEVLDTSGHPIERVRLKAVRESWLTFRGKDSNTSGDFRLFKWNEMKLNQFLYVNGEVVKLWHYPRGPDSGYIVYPGSGSRYGYHDTTPLAHPLGQPAYIVEPFTKGSAPTANGLPTFTIYHQNDDESRRRFGKDSKLTFTAPTDGDYLVRVSDVRGFQGEDFKYTMTIRPRRPDFKLTIGGFADGVPKGSGREFNVKAERLDDFEGPIRIDITDVPEGFHVTSPLTIEAGQLMAFGAIYTGTDTATAENDFAIVTATATIHGKEVTHDIGKLGNIKPIDKPKLLVQVTTNESGAARTGTTTDPLEFTIAPGETISARVRVKRDGFNSRVELGSHDAGRNLPHGVYVDNIGLNGLLIVEGQTEREFFITADDWVPETTKHFHIRTTAEKGIVSNPLILHVQKK
jgi:WD40 repeat protein